MAEPKKEEAERKGWPWPHPVTPGAPGGEWEPPEGVTDVALLVPSTTGKPSSSYGNAAGIGYPVLGVPGLDAKYILSSDGSTRLYGEGH